MHDKLDSLIDRVHHLPPSPRLLVKLLNVFKQPNRDIDEVVRLIGHDPSFTAEVLKRCNSAAHSGVEPAQDMFEAVTRLGFYEIYSIVTAMFAASAILRPEARGGAAVEVLWKHSVAVAVAASVLAEESGESNAAAFTAGLLHDIGKIVMLSAEKNHYTQAIQNAGMFKRPVVIAEKEIFGFDHTEVSARLLTRWNLPPNIIAAVRHHHDLAGAEPFTQITACLHLANLVAHRTNDKLAGALKDFPATTESLAILQFTPEKLSALMPRLNEAYLKAQRLIPG